MAITLCSLAVNAQDKKKSPETYNDYVITSKGDTLICKVNTPLFSWPNYQTAKMSETQNIRLGEIKEYYIKKRQVIFRSIVLDGQKKPNFLPVVENGKISLYQSIYTSQYTIIWYVSKGADTAYLLKTNDISFTRKDRQNRFEDMLKDNPVVYDRFLAEKKFTYKDLQNIVHLYNAGKP